MKSDDKKEKKPSDHAVFTYGRMNPPTAGHALLIKKTMEHAKSVGADHHIFVSHSNDSSKNPLTAADKLGYINAAIKGAGVRASHKDLAGPLQIAKELHNQGYKKLTMVVGSDRVDHFKRVLDQYNGKDYNFDSIKIVSAGKRDSNDDGVSGISGSKLRSMAISGDSEGFKKHLMPGLEKKGDEIYKKVRGALGLKEGCTMSENIRNTIPVLLMNEDQKLKLVDLTEDEKQSILVKSLRLGEDYSEVEKLYRRGIREWMVVKSRTTLTKEQFAMATVNKNLQENKKPLASFSSWRRKDAK